MEITSFNTVESSSTRDAFNDPSVQQLFTANKLDARPVISFQVSQDILGFKKQLLLDLNQKLFNLKVSSERLTDPSFFSSLHSLSVVSSNPFSVLASAENINSDNFQSKFASASAQDITGNASATEYTALEGVSGYLLIEGQRLAVGTNPYETKSDRGYPDTLAELKNRINSFSVESRADIVNGKLVIFSPAGRPVSVGDFTYGGNEDGLQIVPVPQRDVSDILNGFLSGFDPRIETKFASVQQLRSFTAEDISDNALATASTPLYGISGNVIINGIPVAFDTSGIADSLQSFANRVNALSSSVGATASIVDNRLVLASTDFTQTLDVRDETVGGLAGGPGGLGLSRSANSGATDTSAASTIGLYDITVIGTAQRQKNISYSAAEITGNSSATETTALGLSGNLVINGTKVSMLAFESLKDIASVINGMGAGVTATILNGRLVLKSSKPNAVGFTLVDNTPRVGVSIGIGLGPASREVKSVPLSVLHGNLNADENTFFSGIQGALQFKNSNTNIFAVIDADTISVGANTWQAGDMVTLNPGGATKEELQIAAISGGTVDFTTAMQFAHFAFESATNIRTIQVGLQGTTDTARRLVDAINNARGMGVTAAIEENHIVFRAAQPVMSAINDATTGGYAGTPGSFGFTLSSATVVAPQNAVYQVNGVTHSQPTNTVSDGVPGVRFQLQSGQFSGSADITLSTQVTEQDNVTNIEDMIKNFVLKFNESIGVLNRFTQFDTETKTENFTTGEGTFFANAGMDALKDMLVSAVTSPVKLSETRKVSIEDIGARLDEKLNGILNSSLSLDEDKLKKEITQNLKTVVGLFNSQFNGIGARISTLLNTLILGDGVTGVDIRAQDKFSLFKQFEFPTVFSLGKEKQGQLFSEQA